MLVYFIISSNWLEFVLMVVLSSQSFMTQSLTMETIGYPRQETGSVDFKTMANHTAARVLEEVGGCDL